MDTGPRRSKSLKRRLSDNAVKLCLPPIQTPTSFIAHVHESYEYRKDRRRMEEQYEAYHSAAPPPSAFGRRVRSNVNFKMIEPRQEAPDMEAGDQTQQQRSTSLTRGMFGSFRGRRRRGGSDESQTSGTASSSAVATMTTDDSSTSVQTLHTVSTRTARQQYRFQPAEEYYDEEERVEPNWYEDDFIADARSRSFLLLETYSPWLTGQATRKPRVWSFVPGSQRDPFVMTADPFIQTKDPWLLPPMENLR